MMKTLENIKDKLDIIAQKYIGRTLISTECTTWLQLQHKMVGEIITILEEKSQETKEELYYIQNGYLGNAILWWRKNSCGYTVNIKNAGKYTRDKTIAIINNRPNKDSAWLCSYIDNNVKAQVLTVENNNLDNSFKLTNKT